MQHVSGRALPKASLVPQSFSITAMAADGAHFCARGVSRQYIWAIVAHLPRRLTVIIASQADARECSRSARRAHEGVAWRRLLAAMRCAIFSRPPGHDEAKTPIAFPSSSPHASSFYFCRADVRPRYFAAIRRAAATHQRYNVVDTTQNAAGVAPSIDCRQGGVENDGEVVARVPRAGPSRYADIRRASHADIYSKAPATPSARSSRHVDDVEPISLQASFSASMPRCGRRDEPPPSLAAAEDIFPAGSAGHRSRKEITGTVDTAGARATSSPSLPQVYGHAQSGFTEQSHNTTRRPLARIPLFLYTYRPPSPGRPRFLDTAAATMMPGRHISTDFLSGQCGIRSFIYISYHHAEIGVDSSSN